MMNTKFIAVDRDKPNPLIIRSAGRIIRSGGLVAFPTETVYGLGADALNPDAVSRIYEAKGRPSDNPLILHVARFAECEQLVEMNYTARALMYKFWPGPLTMVLPAKPCIPLITRGCLDTAAIRMPDNLIARNLIHESHTAIAAPSANLSGRPSPTNAESVYYDMKGKIDMIIDGGSVRIGIESTVIDVTDPGHVLLLRPGGTSREDIEKTLDAPIYLPDDHSARRSPGTHYKHYAPSIPVNIWRTGTDFPVREAATSGYLGIHEPPCKTARTLIFANYEEYARELFASFRKLEREGCTMIITEWPEDDTGISEGLRDRITRASYV